ncbi:MAG: hypothetical protein ACLTVE_10070 [Clostridia bacterium]
MYRKYKKFQVVKIVISIGFKSYRYRFDTMKWELSYLDGVIIKTPPV